jgi:serine/threonine-protein kinase
MDPSVESICKTLSRSRLLPPQEVLDLRKRWLQAAGSNSQDSRQFVQWLVAHRALTGYQVSVIQRGHADQLFLGPYKILERTSQGRLAGVYQAVHPTGAVVALEVLPPSQARNQQLLARFQREAQRALSLTHLHLLRAFQTGAGKTLHYLVTEHLAGETLDDVLRRRGQLSPAEAVRLGHQTLLGLQHIHQNGFVHRNIQPRNLFLVGGQEKTALTATLKILETRAVHPVSGETGTERTGKDQGPEPHLYASPEQLRDARSTDRRADLFSVGCVLYQGLTGQLPFVDPDIIRLGSQPPRSPRQIDPAIPLGLEQVVLRLLARDPAQRYPDATSADRDLRAFPLLGPEPVPLEQDPKMIAYLAWLAAPATSDHPVVAAEQVDFTEDQIEILDEEPEFFTGPVEILEEGEQEIIEAAEIIEEPPQEEGPNPWANLE